MTGQPASDFDAMVEKAASALASKSDYNPNDVDPKLWGTLRDAWEGVAGALLEAAGVPALLAEVEGLRLWRGWEERALKAEAENRVLRRDVEARAKLVAVEVLRDTRERAERAEAAARAFAEAIQTFLGWHGYDNAEGLADALAAHPGWTENPSESRQEER